MSNITSQFGSILVLFCGVPCVALAQQPGSIYLLNGMSAGSNVSMFSVDLSSGKVQSRVNLVGSSPFDVFILPDYEDRFVVIGRGENNQPEEFLAIPMDRPSAPKSIPMKYADGYSILFTGLLGESSRDPRFLVASTHGKENRFDWYSLASGEQPQTLSESEAANVMTHDIYRSWNYFLSEGGGKLLFDSKVPLDAPPPLLPDAAKGKDLF